MSHRFNNKEVISDIGENPVHGLIRAEDNLL